MMCSSKEVDELIENEVCNRLIRLSCAKMVNSKNERGGAKLHRNLLILHLLRRARNEQKRPTAEPVGPEVLPEGDFNSSPSEITAEAAAARCCDNAEIHAESEGHGIGARGNESLLDLSGSWIRSKTDSLDFEEYGSNSVGCTTIDSRLVGQPFASDELRAEDEYEVTKSDEQTGSSMISCSAPEQFFENDLVVDCSKSDDEQSSSSGSDEDEENCESRPHRQRKRKTSMSRSTSPSTPKKCCVEERQLTGLISVFNTGLSVVADQFLPRSTGNPLLQQTSDQLGSSLVRIACNPLICK